MSHNEKDQQGLTGKHFEIKSRDRTLLLLTTHQNSNSYAVHHKENILGLDSELRFRVFDSVLKEIHDISKFSFEKMWSDEVSLSH